MRFTLALASVAVLALAATATAQPVLVAPVSYSPAFQASLARDLGVREGAYLANDISRAVTRALARRGIASSDNGVAIEISIIDADPNRPTFQQLNRRPGLDIASVSTGGAELHAVLRAADGRTLSEVSFRKYDDALADLVGPPTTWTTAERAINQFAEKVADTYQAQSPAR